MVLSYYVQCQESFRPAGTTRAQLSVEWRAKTAAQKAAWKNAYLTVQRSEAHVNAERALATAARHHINNLVNVPGGQHDLQQWIRILRRRIPRVIAQYGDVIELHVGVRQDWQALHDLEQGQPNANNDSLQHPLLRVARENQAIVQARGRQAALQALRETPPVPPDAAGVNIMPEDWIVGEKPGDRRPILNAARFAQELHAPDAGLPQPGVGIWRPHLHIRGGQCDGILWLQFDHHDRLIDRVFRKDVFQDDLDWIDPRQWHGDVRNPHTKIPMELECHQALLTVPGLQNVVQTRQTNPYPRHLIDNNLLTFRLYTEWAIYRDLNQLILNHENVGTHVPEPMIWYVAEALAMCGKAMEQGSFVAPNPNWKQIVHRDIKSTNVFLAVPGAVYPDYPKILLADFGLAFKTTVADPNNPEWWNTGCGTNGFKAPEMMRWVDAVSKNAVNSWPVLDKANVFGVGATLRCLVTRDWRSTQPGWLGIGDLDDTLTPLPVPAPWPINQYSQPLIDLVNDCLLFQPGLRPTFDQILQRIRFNTNEMPGAPNLSQRMRSGTANPWFRDALLPVIMANPYVNGLARAHLP